MARFAKGDYVVHPGQGMCQVAGVVERTFTPPAPADQPNAAPEPQTRLEYELYPASGARLRICYPVDKEDTLRLPVSRKEAQALIDEMPRLPDDTFSDPHTWTVEEHFMGSLRQGDCRDALCTVKTMYGRIESTRASGKKPKVCYDRIFKAARDRAFLELSIALGTTPEEVERLVAQRFAAV